MSDLSFHPVSATATFVEVVIPLATPKAYTYMVPEEMVSDIGFGKRVEVQFGRNRLYAGLIVGIGSEAPEGYQPKAILSVIDVHAIINIQQYRLWQWISQYYCCTIGEVMNAALPANLKLSSETRVVLSPLFDENYGGLDDKEYLIAEALSIQNELSIADIQGILNQKTVYPLIRKLLDKRIIFLTEDLKEKYKPRKVYCVRLAEPYASQSELMEEAFEKLSRSNKQVDTLMTYLQMIRKNDYIKRAELCKKAKVDSSVVRAMEKKGVLEIYEQEISRLGAFDGDTESLQVLSEQQVRALKEIREQIQEKNVLLLHGVTGSGKTRVYVELIQEALQRGEQVLYLLPEIALTAQIIQRLQKVFGDEIVVYHSRLNNNERVELWQEVLNGKSIVLGARSALFLPFEKLKWIIVDEEHDPSFKQYNPNPRYHGRDAAIVAANIHNAKVILGTATPSLESYFNAKSGKYGLVEMPERFGGLQLPEVGIVDKKAEFKKEGMHPLFSQELIKAIATTIEQNEQVILFQNRRGYAPTYRCGTCGWHSECIHCDVSLTYHKFHNNLKCHYCGYSTTLPVSCPACGTRSLTLQGFGTEKIEDELKIFFPELRIQRMDYDTVRGKDGHTKIIDAFQDGAIDILVGTQMVTKGLDFDRVGLVGVLSADQLLHFPDFRASERGFQLMVQVSGRAGRKGKQGKVLIQTLNPGYPVLAKVVASDYHGFYAEEIAERQQFAYPPFIRLIKISLKHKQAKTVNDAARMYSLFIKKHLGDRVKGPAIPYVSRVRSYYVLDFLVKLEKDTKSITRIKEVLMEAMYQLHDEKGFSGVRVSIDVDPF